MNHIRKSKSLSWIAVGAAAFLAWSCGAEAPDDVEQTRAVVTELNADAAAATESNECNLFYPEHITIGISSVTTSSVKLSVHNSYQENADVEILASSFGDDGLSVATPARVQVAPGATLVVEVRASELSLASREDIRGGRVSFTAVARFANGASAKDSSKSVYYRLTPAGALLSRTPNLRAEDIRPELAKVIGTDPAVAIKTAINMSRPFGATATRAADGRNADKLAADESLNLPAPSAAQTTTLCFKFTVGWDDSGIGEDYYNSKNRADRNALYNYVRLWDGSYDYSFYLDESGGRCHTLQMERGRTYNANIYAAGTPGGRVLEFTWPGGAPVYYDGPLYVGSASSQELVIDDEASDYIWQGYLAAALALSKAPGIGSGGIEFVFDDCPSGADACYSPEDDIIYIDNPDNKFAVAHELGHKILRLAGAGTNVDYSINASLPCASTPVDGRDVHTQVSQEWQSSAYIEGFANFYADMAFNNVNEEDCWNYFPLTGAGMDCDSGVGTDTPRKRLYQTCVTAGSNSGKSGQGVEIDWERVFWNVRTHGTNDPSFNSMLQWMAAAEDLGFTKSNIYSKLNQAANSYLGAINNRWDTHSVNHRIDY